MQLPPAFLRRLGAAGARDNAWRACEEYRLALVQVDALAGRLVLRRSIEVADGPDRPSQPGRELAPAHDPAASRVAG